MGEYKPDTGRHVPSEGETRAQPEGGDGMAYLRKNSGRWGCGLEKRRVKKKISEEELKSHLMGVKEHSKHEDHGIRSHHFMANRWGESRNW